MGKYTSDTKCPGHMTDISVNLYVSFLFIHLSAAYALGTGLGTGDSAVTKQKKTFFLIELNVLLRRSFPSKQSQYNSENHK